MTDEARKHKFLWLDLETTGLNPHSNRILEWAAVLAEDAHDGTMQPVEEYSAAIHVPADDPFIEKEMDDFVRNMHTKNGLLAECRASTTTLQESEEFLIELVGGPDTRQVMLAGGSVFFDLAFLRVHMPRFARCLHYRVFDVSTLKTAVRTWGDVDLPDIKADVHRALPDILATLREARELKPHLWRVSDCMGKALTAAKLAAKAKAK